MRRSIRIAGVVAAGVVISTGLAACSSNGDGDGGGSGDVTISYGLWDANQLPAYQQCAADFTEKTGIGVDVEQIGWDDYWQKITTGLVSGQTYDVFTSHLAYYPEFQANGQVLPLDDYIEKDGLDLSIYQDGLADLWVGQDGSRYGLPKDFDTIALFYNEQATEAAGYTADDLANLDWNPQDGGSYEKLIAHLTIDKNGVRGDEAGFDKKNVKQYGTWMEGSGGADGQTQWSMFTGTLGWSHADGVWGTHYNYDAPEFKETIAWWYSLVEKGYMPSLEQQTGVSWSEQLAAGNVALVPNGSWQTGGVFGNASDTFTPKLAPLPVGPSGERATMFNGLADNIAVTTKHPDESWEWVKYLASTDCQDTVADAAVVFPAIKTSTDKAKAAFEAKGVDVEPFLVNVEEGTTFLFPITDHKSDVNAIMTPAMEAIMSGKEGVDSLDKANEQVNALFQ